MIFDLSGKRIWVAGHHGMVGSAVVRRLASENCVILTAHRDELDLVKQQAVQDWILHHRPDVVVLAAAKVSEIAANNGFPVDFLCQNLMIEANVIHVAHLADFPRLLFLGSSCIYPRLAPQPIQEDSLLIGPLEPTNEWYAIAKITRLKLVQAYRKQHGRDWISAMPTNLYGPGDNYDLHTSHVLPALLRRFHEAKRNGDNEVTVWGSGKPLREFMYCDDLADALVFLLQNYSDDLPINVGSGIEVSIQELAETIADIVGNHVQLKWDRTKPDGTPRKLMDSSRLHKLGWNNIRALRDGIKLTYNDARIRLP